MARRVQYSGRIVLQPHGLPVNQSAIWWRRLRGVDAEPCRLRSDQVEERQVILVQVDGRAGKTLEPERCTDVVDVGVGNQDLLERKTLFSKPLVDAADIVTGVDHDGLARLLIAQNCAVTLQKTNRKS